MLGALTCAVVAVSIVQALLSPAITCPACTLDAHAIVLLLHDYPGTAAHVWIVYCLPGGKQAE